MRLLAGLYGTLSYWRAGCGRKPFYAAQRQFVTFRRLNGAHGFKVTHEGVAMDP